MILKLPVTVFGQKTYPEKGKSGGAHKWRAVSLLVPNATGGRDAYDEFLGEIAQTKEIPEGNYIGLFSPKVVDGAKGKIFSLAFTGVEPVPASK